MSAKITASRRRAFLNALEQTGNQTLSAERAKVSRSWVCLQRSTDPDFDAACREALAVATDKLKSPLSPTLSLKGRGSNGPPLAQWARHDGHELVVSGTGGSGNGRRAQIRRSRLKQWSSKVEARFLAALSATCNVKAACRDVGMASSSAYAHRKRWPGFARAWGEALKAGHWRLELALVSNALYYLDPEETEPPDEL